MTTPADLHARAAALLTEIATAREHVSPDAWIHRIAEAGLYTFRVPRSHGGPGGSMCDVIRFVIDVASVDPDIAGALLPGFGLVDRVLFSSDDAELRHWLPRVLAGEVFGHAGAQRGGHSLLPAHDQLLRAAVETGLAKNALAEAAHCTHHPAWPIEPGGAIASDVYAAEATLLHAAVALEAAGRGGLTQGLLTEVSDAVAQARFFAARAAQEAARTLVDVGPANTASGETRPERRGRRARGVAQPPRRPWRAAVVRHGLPDRPAPATANLF